MRFAAAREAALASGWRYTVVAGWRGHVMTVLDGLSAQRRELRDRLGLEEQLLRSAAAGPVRFGDLVNLTSVPTVARAPALHLIWHRMLSIDLARPKPRVTTGWGTDPNMRQSRRSRVPTSAHDDACR